MKNIFLTFLTATSLLTAQQTVVFDFGGVMTGQPNREAVVDFIRTSFQLSEEDFEKVNAEKRQAVKLGATDERFWVEFAKRKGVRLPATWSEDFRQVMKKAIGINPEMYELVDQLKEKKVPVAMLSNIDERLSRLIREFGFYAPFDPCLLSCEIGAEKPDPKAYSLLLDKLGLPAKDVIFIDDRAENVEQGKKQGLDAILFQSPEQLRQELQHRDLF